MPGSTVVSIVGDHLKAMQHSEFATSFEATEFLNALRDPPILQDLKTRVGADAVSLTFRDRRGAFHFFPYGLEDIPFGEAAAQTDSCVACGRPWDTGDCLVVADIHQWPPDTVCKFALAEEFNAYVTLPVRIGRRTIFILTIYSRQARQWGGQDLCTAEIAGMDLLHARIFPDRQHRLH